MFLLLKTQGNTLEEKDTSSKIIYIYSDNYVRTRILAPRHHIFCHGLNVSRPWRHPIAGSSYLTKQTRTDMSAKVCKYRTVVRGGPWVSAVTALVLCKFVLFSVINPSYFIFWFDKPQVLPMWQYQYSVYIFKSINKIHYRILIYLVG